MLQLVVILYTSYYSQVIVLSREHARQWLGSKNYYGCVLGVYIWVCSCSLHRELNIPYCVVSEGTIVVYRNISYSFRSLLELRKIFEHSLLTNSVPCISHTLFGVLK